MAKFNTYTSTEQVRARKVTDEDGETIVTEAGPIRVPQGDYVTEDSRTIRGDEFENRFRAKSKPKAKAKAKPKTTSKSTDESTTTDPASKVAAARARKSS